MVKKFHTTVLGWVIKPIFTIIIGRAFISFCSLLGYHPDLWLAELVASMIDHPSAELVEASKWIISAFIVIIIWLLLEVRIKINSKNSPLDGSIILECTREKLPRFVPDNGKINILDTQYNARNSSGFGFSIRIGEPNKEWDWSYVNVCHKCVVKNYASETAFNIMIKMKTSFHEVIQQNQGVRQTGKEIATQEYIITIPALRGNGDDLFEFYIVNYSQKEFTYSVPLDTVFIGCIGDKKNQNVRIGYTSGGSVNVGAGLMPADFSKVEK